MRCPLFFGIWFVLISPLPGFAQEKFATAEIAWLESDQAMTYKALEAATFVDSLSKPLQAKSYYYLKVWVDGKRPTGMPMLLCDSFWEVYMVFADSLSSVRELGWNRNTLPIVMELPDSLAQQPYIYLRCYNYQQRAYPWFGFYWMTPNYLETEFNAQPEDFVLEHILPNAGASGLILTFIIFFGALYLSNPSQKVYLLYIIYLIPLGLYLFHRSTYVTYQLLPTAAWKFPYWFLLMDMPVQVIFHIAYTAFSFTFLNARQNYPVYYRAGSVVIVAGIIFTLVFAIGMYLEPYADTWVIAFQIERLLITIFSIWANLYVIIYRKDRIALIVTLGSLVFLLGAWGAFFYHMNMMRLGAILEVIFFSLGIGYKLNLERREKDHIKTALINQLRETETLQKRYNAELEKEVKIRSEELVEKAKQIEEEKKEKMKAQLESKVEEMKMVAMRSQMNPHFLFNSLNSIRHLIIKHQTTEAYDYLSEFASLMRSVLENAEKEAITLRQELEVIQTYISLERLRFKDDFTFSLSIHEDLPTAELLVPPLIIQPFLENAIIHGLAPKAADKYLHLEIKASAEQLIITVEDNGVGRKLPLRPAEGSKKKPMAINIANERLELFVSHYAPGAIEPPQIALQDKSDENGQAAGTIVSINLPMITSTRA